jgi:pimeloyl-ACP methyl ester carboxylesterase
MTTPAPNGSRKVRKSAPAAPKTDAPRKVHCVEPERNELVLHGNRISYYSAGEGPVLLLVHGIASNADTWLPSIPLLARQYTVVAPDLPGHGNSDKPPGDYSLGALASTLRDLLIVLGHDRATIVGHSLGGGVAMQFSYQFPDRAERLVLVSSGGLGNSVSPLLRAASLPGSELFVAATVAPIAAVGRFVGNGMRKLGLQPAADLLEVARGFASLADPPTRAAFLDTLRAVVGPGGQRVDATNRLYLAEGIPTLLLWGERDPIIPVAHGRRAHEVMPGSRFVVFPESGHMPQVDAPHRFADVLLDFLSATKPAQLSVERLTELLRKGVSATTDPRSRGTGGKPPSSGSRRSSSGA